MHKASVLLAAILSVPALPLRADTATTNHTQLVPTTWPASANPRPLPTTYADVKVIPVERGATTSGTTGATTQPTTAASPLTLNGYIAPVDAFEVKLKLKRFTTPLTVTKVVAHGAMVKAGDALIAFDTAEIDQDILEATSDLDVAKAAVAKAEFDSAAGDRSDAATLEERTDALADAQTAVDWWKKVDGPDFLKRIDLGLKAAEDAIDDQSDELEQLRKMYKSEELTNATADIVVKRAVRQYERSKEQQAISIHSADKQKATTYVDQGQSVARALDAAKRALDEQNAQMAQSKVTRAAAVLKARLALKDAQKKLNELEKEKSSLDVKSPVDGIVLYGSFANGTWTGSTADAIKPSEKQDASKPLMTVIQPGKIRVVAKIDEATVFKFKPDANAVVTPIAMPDLHLTGKTQPLAPLTSADGSYEGKIELGQADPRLLPGMKVKLELAAEGGH